MIKIFDDAPFTESNVTDALKTATKAVTNIDVDEIKDEIKHQQAEWNGGKKLTYEADTDKKGNVLTDADGNVVFKKELDKNGNTIDVDSPDGYNRAMAYTNIAVDKGSEGLNQKMDDILGKMDPNRYNSRSIIARSRNSILQFPVYITNTIRVNEAHIVSKMFERVYTTFVQTALNANPVVSEDDINDLVFLKQFHTNLKESGDLFVNEFYQPIDDIDSMMKGSLIWEEKVTDTMDVTFRWIPCNDITLIQENSRLMNEPLAGLKYLQEAKTTNDGTIRMDATKDTTDTEKVRLTNDDLTDMARTRLKAGATNDEIKAEVDKLKEEIENKKLPGYVFDGAAYFRYSVKNRGERTTKDEFIPKKEENEKHIGSVTRASLKDSDVKKINGMLPFTIEATFRVKPKEGAGYTVTFIIGIKTVLHLIRPQDLAEDLDALVTGNMKNLRKVKYKTGEIKFNEYIFDIKNLKKNAAKRVDHNKKWINTLNRLAEFDKLNGSLLKQPAKFINGEIPVPNGTLVLSQADVTMLANSTGIDLSSVSNAKRLAKALFLIAVVIIDGSAGTMKVLFTDMDNEWDIQSIAAIDAEVQKTDNSPLLRELNKMINK